MPQRIIIPLLVLYLLGMSSCTRTLWTGGKLTEITLEEWIPVEFTDNLLFLEVSINQRPYRFMLDTGAPNVIDQRIAEELGLRVVSSNYVTDSQRQRRRQDIVELGELNFAGQTILNSRAVVADLSHFACTNIDGLIGSNVLHHFDLEIDYQRPAVRFFRNRDTTELKADFPLEFGFEMNAQKTPKINAHVGGEERRFSFDTGSASSITMGGIKPDELDGVLKSRWIYGQTSRGIFGARTDTTHFALLDEFAFTDYDLRFSRVYATMRSRASNLIGNRFWKNYRVVISWAHRRAFLREAKPDMEELASTQIYLTYADQHVKLKAIGSEFLEKYAYLAPEMLVLSMNGRSLEYIDETDFCNLPHEDRYELVVVDREGELHTLDLRDEIVVF